MRDHAPPAMEIAAGEYGYTLDYFRHMLEAHAVDVQQADATRCGGVTGFLQVASLCEAYHIDLSAHCAPALHGSLGCIAPRFRHLEWFHDHVRIEHMLFDGAPIPRNGANPAGSPAAWSGAGVEASRCRALRSAGEGLIDGGNRDRWRRGARDCVVGAWLAGSVSSAGSPNTQRCGGQPNPARSRRAGN